MRTKQVAMPEPVSYEPFACTLADDFRNTVNIFTDQILRSLGVPSCLLQTMTRPLICDLTKDEACVGILRALARKPWEPLHWDVLHDRMEEMGLGSKWEEFLEQGRPFDVRGSWHDLKREASRTAIQKGLRNWRKHLEKCFGDFEPVRGLCTCNEPVEIPF